MKVCLTYWCPPIYTAVHAVMVSTEEATLWKGGINKWRWTPFAVTDTITYMYYVSKHTQKVAV